MDGDLPVVPLLDALEVPASPSTLVQVLEDDSHPHVVMEQHMVPMRDGTRLATDVYRPALSPGQVDESCARPVVLHRTPYNKEKSPRTEMALLPDGSLSTPIDNPDTAERFARRGYIVVMQVVHARCMRGACMCM
jgi:predicted acyl esterase